MSGQRRKGGGSMAMRLALIRNIHGYLGLFIAPSVVFFAVTGALQLFSLHEAHGDYHPPAIIEKLGTLHKDQRFALKEHKARPPAAAATAAAAPPEADHDHGDHDHGDADAADHDHDHADAGPAGPAKAPAAAKPGEAKPAEAGPPLKEVALKWLFLLVATGLTLSTLLGVWMALLPHRRNALGISLLIAGLVLPAALALL